MYDINNDKRYDIIDQIYDIIGCYDIIVKLWYQDAMISYIYIWYHTQYHTYDIIYDISYDMSYDIIGQPFDIAVFRIVVKSLYLSYDIIFLIKIWFAQEKL